MAKNKKKNGVQIVEKVNMPDIEEKLYIGFIPRLLIIILLFIISFGLCVFFMVSSIYNNNDRVISYQESSNLDYQVCLKSNDFYETNCLGKNMKYVANLIDNIKLTYRYNFLENDNVNLNFDYDIIGKIVISDKNSNKSYFEKEYVLKEKKNVSTGEGNSLVIDESIDIDYEKYNNLAIEFNKAYGVNTDSKLVIYMNVHKKNPDDANYKVDNGNLLYVSIPLSERGIDVSIDSNNVNHSGNFVIKDNDYSKSIVYGVLALIFIVVSMLLIVRIIRTINGLFISRSKYDKYVSKILKEYDRLIGEARTKVSFEGKEVIKFDKFTELLDMHDNLGLPIMYYNVTSHVKCYFYIVKDNVVYLHVVKAVDLES